VAKPQVVAILVYWLLTGHSNNINILWSAWHW